MSETESHHGAPSLEAARARIVPPDLAHRPHQLTDPLPIWRVRNTLRNRSEIYPTHLGYSEFGVAILAD